MPTTFLEVGISIGLSGEILRRYTAYMLMRWEHKERELCSKHYTEYAKEWAQRFKDGLEYQHSDCDGVAVLNTIDSRGEEDRDQIKNKAEYYQSR